MWEKNKGTTECDKRTVTCDVGTAQWEDETVKCEEKNRKITECDIRTVKCDVGTAQCKDKTIKCEKKKKGKPPNMTIVLSNVMLELHNMRM